jgi:hypothetical protein
VAESETLQKAEVLYMEQSSKLTGKDNLITGNKKGELHLSKWSKGK